MVATDRSEPRFYNVTGALPGHLEDEDGRSVAFLRALDVSASGIGLEVEQYVDPGLTVQVRGPQATVRLAVVYCVYVPALRTHRMGLKAVDRAVDLVAWFRAQGGLYLVRLDDGQVLPSGPLASPRAK